MPTAPFPSDLHRHRSLCPACGSASIRIHTSVEVQVDVVVSEAEEALTVVDEALGDAAWDERSPAACPQCEWRGRVADLAEHSLTALEP